MFFVCVVGSLQAPQKSEAVQLKTSPVHSKTVGCSTTQDLGAAVTAAVSSAVEQLSASSITDSVSYTSSTELDEMLATKPKPPPALFPSKLLHPATCSKLAHSVLVEGEMSTEPDEMSPAVRDGEEMESIPSVSSVASLENKSTLPMLGICDATRMESDISSEPPIFHTSFTDGQGAVDCSVDEQSNFVGLLSSQSSLKVTDMNENIRKKEFVDNLCEVKDSKMTVAFQEIAGLSNRQKTMSELFDNSHYLPVTTSTVVVNMVLSSVVTRPGNQNSATLESGLANSQENSDGNVSVANEASTQEASSLVSSAVMSDKKSDQEKSSGGAEESSQCHANDGNKSDVADQIPSSEDGKQKKSKSPESDRRRSRSRSRKRDRSRSHERRKRRSRSRQHKKKRSRSSDRSGKQSGAKSPSYSPERNSGRRRKHKRSRSSSRKQHHSRTRRTSRSRSSRSRSRDSRRRSRSTDRSRHKWKSRSPSKDRSRRSVSKDRRASRDKNTERRDNHSRSQSREMRRRSRSRSRDLRRWSRSSDQDRHKQELRSRSRDRSRRSISKDRKASHDRDTERRSITVSVRNEKSQLQPDRASTSFSRNYPSDDSPHRRDRSPSRDERAMAKRDEEAVRAKPRNSDVRRSVSSQQSDSDRSSVESSHRRRSREENVAENNRIAVISSSSGTNRQRRSEEFELDEEPPADLPTAYDPSEPTEDNFRDDRKVLDHGRMPQHWVPPANHRMPVVDMSRPPPGFPSRLPAPPSARFPQGPPREDLKSTVGPPNQFRVGPPDAGRPPLLNVPLPLPRPGEVVPPMAFTRPLLTTPVGALPPPPPPSVQPVRLPRAINVDTVPLIVRGPMEPARLLFVPPGVGQPVRLADATALVGLPRIVCPPPPAQGTMPDLVRLPIGQPQPPPGTVLSGPPPFGSMNQVIVRPAPMMISHVPEHTELPQSAPQVITTLPISQVPRMSAGGHLLVSNMPEIPPPPPHGSQPPLPPMTVPARPPDQLQPAPSLSSSSASSPSSGSQDAEDLLLERYSTKPEPPHSPFPSQKAPDLAKPEPLQSLLPSQKVLDMPKPEPPQSLFPSQKAPDLPKPEPLATLSPSPKSPDAPKTTADVQEKSPGRKSGELDKSQRPEPPPSLPVPDLKTAVTVPSEEVAVSTSEALPSDPRLLVQFLLKQTRQSTAVPGGDGPEASKLSPPQELHSPAISDGSPEKANKDNLAYSPSQADYLGDDEESHPLENVREMKVCLY